MFRACMHLRVTSKGVGHGGLTPAGSLLVGEREPPPGSPVLWDPQVVKWGCLPLFSLGGPSGRRVSTQRRGANSELAW